MKQKCIFCPVLKGKACDAVSLDYYLECDVAQAIKEGHRVRKEDVENGCVDYKDWQRQKAETES